MSLDIKKLGLTATAMLVALSLGAQQPAAAPAAPIAGGVVGEVTQWKGVVQSVDLQTRWVVVQGMQGTIHAFKAQKGVNLNSVKAGDSLTVDYVESIAVYLRKATDPPVAGSANLTTVKPKGLPAVTDVSVTEVQANVTAVNQAKRSLTVVGPGAKSYTFTVDPSVTAFSQVKVGDQIVVRYTESIAVKVTK